MSSVDPTVGFAIYTFFKMLLERGWKKIEGKTPEEILKMTNEEEERSDTLQEKQEEG